MDRKRTIAEPRLKTVLWSDARECGCGISYAATETENKSTYRWNDSHNNIHKARKDYNGTRCQNTNIGFEVNANGP